MAKGSGKQWKAIILVEDDDPRYLELVRANIYAGGYRVSTATDGATALDLAETQKPDLVILDVMLPDVDGHEVSHPIREFSLVPIIMFTARGEQFHKVKGLLLGADDRVTKPFGVGELVAQVEAALRRVNRLQRGRPA